MKKKIYEDYLPRMASYLYAKAQASSYRRKKIHLNEQFDIDKEYLISLLIEQECKCILSKIPFVLTNNYASVAGDINKIFWPSIDRIDSSKGYIKGNIQIICTGLNLAKNEYEQKHILEFIEQLKNPSENYLVLSTLDKNHNPQSNQTLAWQPINYNGRNASSTNRKQLLSNHSIEIKEINTKKQILLKTVLNARDNEAIIRRRKLETIIELGIPIYKKYSDGKTKGRPGYTYVIEKIHLQKL